ncbi:MAG: FG-GAP repeat protein [Ignavibacteria bacterium]|nr:FG-GAP repeat protein [Ignavibacteria bacterium]
MTGEATGNFFGNSVSTAGDVNGDGYSDVIVEHKIILQIPAEPIYILAEL